MVTIPKSLILNRLGKKNKTKQTCLFPNNDLEHCVNLYAKLIKTNVVMMMLFYAAPDLRGSCTFWGCSAYRGNGTTENISDFVIALFCKTQVYLETGNQPVSNVLWIIIRLV